MGKGCVDGQLVTTLYGSPVPLIGLYIAAATLVCFFCMTFDLVYGLFIRKRPFLPCKLFSMNSFTMTVLAVATKIPVDLTTSMPRAEDQLSKLTGTALLCTSLGFYMPSLGTMGTSERYGNLAALTVIVITMVVNVCMQLETGLIFAFAIEHITVMVCILLLLLLMWSSAIAFKGQKEWFKGLHGPKVSKEAKNAKDVQGLRKLLVKLHLLNYTSNPQTLLCETSHHHAFGLLCTLSSAIVLQAMIRSIALKNLSFCGTTDVSDYKWSIPMVIVAQFLTIVVGTFCIIYRWVSFVSHTDKKDLCAHRLLYFFPENELVDLKWKILPFRFLNKKFSVVFLVAKDFIMDVLIQTQIMLYTCSSRFIGFPIYTVKTFLEYHGICFHDQHTNQDIDQERYNSEEILEFILSSLSVDPFESWIKKMAMKDIMRWINNTYKMDCPNHLFQLISKCPASSRLECGLTRELQASGESLICSTKQSATNVVTQLIEGSHGAQPKFLKSIMLEYELEYKVSCISLLVLSGMLAEFMPSSRREFLKQSSEALDESFFEIIYYVDKKAHTPDLHAETRWTLLKDLWVHWENPNHWFRTEMFSHVFKSCSFKNSEESEFELPHVFELLYGAILATGEIISERYHNLSYSYEPMVVDVQRGLIAIEILIILNFIREKTYGSVKDLFDFLEMFFIEMLYFTLSGLPLAILNVIDGYDPMEIGEGRVKKALKFLCELELLGDKIKWSWPESDTRSRANNVVNNAQVEPGQTSTTAIAAPDCGSEVEAKVSNVVDGKVDNGEASLAAATDDDDDTIREVGSDEIV
ncbi:uncharacterized protein LOC122059428 [Macadamia integrifolia]|uniref:uncharacterized protein LOC122059428 n=1 Tax=Macadamia integrifolia TaxID=60698 RepID=UPI001C52A23F|nr:uncharacterized protein LOC122059428 [Macadamia integrifolia]